MIANRFCQTYPRVALWARMLINIVAVISSDFICDKAAVGI